MSGAGGPPDVELVPALGDAQRESDHRSGEDRGGGHGCLSSKRGLLARAAGTGDRRAAGRQRRSEVAVEVGAAGREAAEHSDGPVEQVLEVLPALRRVGEERVQRRLDAVGAGDARSGVELRRRSPRLAGSRRARRPLEPPRGDCIRRRWPLPPSSRECRVDSCGVVSCGHRNFCGRPVESFYWPASRRGSVHALGERLPHTL